MTAFSRRDFLKTGVTAAAATAATPLLSKGWLALPAAEEPGYFEREFGITDALCRKDEDLDAARQANRDLMAELNRRMPRP